MSFASQLLQLPVSGVAAQQFVSSSDMPGGLLTGGAVGAGPSLSGGAHALVIGADLQDLLNKFAEAQGKAKATDYASYKALYDEYEKYTSNKCTSCNGIIGAGRWCSSINSCGYKFLPRMFADPHACACMRGRSRSNSSNSSNGLKGVLGAGVDLYGGAYNNRSKSPAYYGKRASDWTPGSVVAGRQGLYIAYGDRWVPASYGGLVKKLLRSGSGCNSSLLPSSWLSQCPSSLDCDLTRWSGGLCSSCPSGSDTAAKNITNASKLNIKTLLNAIKTAMDTYNGAAAAAKDATPVNTAKQALATAIGGISAADKTAMGITGAVEAKLTAVTAATPAAGVYNSGLVTAALADFP